MASEYLPSSIPEAVKIGGTAILAVVIAKKLAPKQSASWGLSDGMWVKQADGSVMFVPPGTTTK